MRELYICDTPFQLFNVLNIVFSKGKNKAVIKDLFIINQFETAMNLHRRVKEANVFDNVYLLTRDETKFLPVGISRNIKMALDFLGPVKFMNKRLSLCENKPQIINSYDYIYASGAFSTVAAMKKLNPSATFIMYEDGLGSYRDDYILRSSGGRTNRLFCKVFRVGSEICRPRELLVNNVEFCKSTSVEPHNIHALNDITESYINFSKEIFGFQQTERYAPLLWLTQPIDSTAGGEEARDSVKRVLLNSNIMVDVRLHPRDTDTQYYKDFHLQNNKDLWELRILSCKFSQLPILVSYYSSAQFTPKLLFDIEPPLIFTFRLNKAIEPENLQSFNKATAELRDLYHRPDRIYIPNDEQELRKAISELVEEN